MFLENTSSVKNLAGQCGLVKHQITWKFVVCIHIIDSFISYKYRNSKVWKPWEISWPETCVCVREREGGWEKNHYLPWCYFDFIKYICRGAFGVVHRAIERATTKNWAAKFVRCRPGDKDLVRREIDLMNSLHHPKLLQLHEAFDQPGEMVMILEL